MNYIDKNLLPGEEVLFRTKKHLIIFFYPLVVAVLAIYATQYMLNNFFLEKIAVVPAVVALLFWVSAGLEYWMSEFVVTNKRVMMKEGFFYRHATEVRLNTISQVNIGQSLLGQFLNYGTVAINAFGAYDVYSLIAHPYAFQKCVNTQIDKHGTNG
jgi:uncharacterized membrane protein YdbT with pleckstrin-like domain